ncbi:MAG TPA: hypothetical protein VE646_10960 [Actinomycetota bacterium]|jgi:hypothetical protein|nr:hypothetical protein [Actinomycetota bacterium]
MAYLRHRRRVLLAVLTSVALLAMPATPVQARERSQVPRWRCRIDWQHGPWHVKKLIRCAARHWRVPGGPDKAVSVARCESRLDPSAYNAGGFAGVFQQSTRYWRGRARTYGFPAHSVFNGRANVIVSVRMAHRYGWGPWGCA